jgi:ABC-type multidrug transport system fused ATPase/permease subunit
MKKARHNNFLRFAILIAGAFAVPYFYFTYLIRKLSEKYSDDVELANMAIILTGVVLFIFVLFYVFIMLCDFFYDTASKKIVLRPDVDKAFKWMKALRILDILRLYSTQYFVFLTIYYRDKNDYNELSRIIENKIFQKSLSLKLVYNYNKFLISINNKDKVEELKYFDILKDTYLESIGKKKEISLIYSLDYIKAEHDLFNEDYKKLYANLNNINKDLLNQRESGYYYYLLYIYYKSGKSNKLALSSLEMAKKMYPSLYLLKDLA